MEKKMNKKLRFGFAMIFCIFAANVVFAAELLPIKNKDLTSVLNNFSVLVESGKGDELSIRLIKVQDQGECDGSPQTCPKSTVYAAISELGEYPEQRLYQLPKKHNWRFVRWIKPAKSETESAELELAADVPSKDTQKGWWVEKHYLLRLTLGRAILSEQ